MQTIARFSCRYWRAEGEAERFYRALPAPALVGLEATGHCQWLIDLLEELGLQVWVGDAAQIRASCVRKQKTDPMAGSMTAG